jgi:hypothetical protein
MVRGLCAITGELADSDTRSSEAAEATHIPTTEATVDAVTPFTRAAGGLDIRTTAATDGGIQDIGARVGPTGSRLDLTFRKI